MFLIKLASNYFAFLGYSLKFGIICTSIFSFAKKKIFFLRLLVLLQNKICEHSQLRMINLLKSFL